MTIVLLIFGLFAAWFFRCVVGAELMQREMDRKRLLASRKRY